MKFTGERLTTHVNEYYTYEHLHRYYLAMDFVKSKDVLDIASGEGYGCSLMSSSAKSVVGVDIEGDAIEHAIKNYKKDNLRFINGDIRSIPLPDDSFDVITCFETIEHIEEHNQAIKELKRVLKPNGILLISTPDSESGHHLASRGRNPYHPLELNIQEFSSLLSNSFKSVSFLFQKTINASLIVDDKNQSIGLNEYSGDFKKYNLNEPNQDAQYFIAICSDNEIPNKPKSSLLTYADTRKNTFEKVIFKLKNAFK